MACFIEHPPLQLLKIRVYAELLSWSYYISLTLVSSFFEFIDHLWYLRMRPCQIINFRFLAGDQSRQNSNKNTQSFACASRTLNKSIFLFLNGLIDQWNKIYLFGVRLKWKIAVFNTIYRMLSGEFFFIKRNWESMLFLFFYH